MPNGEDISETPEQAGAKGKNKIIPEIITHINKLEEKINMLKEGIQEAKDLQTVNKLDIINLKNEIEQIKLSMTTLSPESIENIRALEKLSEKIGKAENIKNDIDKLKSDVNKLKPVKLEDVYTNINLLQQRMNEFEKRTPAESIPNDFSTRLKTLEKRMDSAKPSIPNDFSTRLKTLEKRMDSAKPSIPNDFSTRLKTLEKRMESMKQAAPRINVCKKCGAVLNPRAKFCGKCGAKM